MALKLKIFPYKTEVEISEGETLLRVLQRQEISDFEAPCAGRGTCGKCRIRIRKGNFSVVTDTERRHLSEQELEHGIRLACCTTLLNEEETAEIKLLKENEKTVLLQQKPEQIQKMNPFFDCDDKRYLGVAVDIGTTTVACIMTDLRTGQICGTASARNPQTAIGGDVISRISFTISEPQGLLKLQEMIVKCLNELTLTMLQEAEEKAEHVTGYMIAANSTMLHLLLGVDPASIARYPFTPVFTESRRLPATETGLDKYAPEAEVCTMPGVSGYIGADIVAGTGITNLKKRAGNVMFIDIGTNGEMVLSCRGKLFACSCAAGPALEGMNITCGMRAAEGAIEHVEFKDGKFNLQIIGNSEPKGICGSGVLETTAALLKAGGIQCSGKINEKTDTLFPYLYKEGKDRGFCLYTGKKKIVFTQNDIRQIQLAKGAILSGFSALTSTAGIKLEELDLVIIAGQFGAYLRPEVLTTAGILPDTVKNKVEYVGNSSLDGAYRALCDKEWMKTAELMAGDIEYIELGNVEGYDRLLMKCMSFPLKGGQKEGKR